MTKEISAVTTELRAERKIVKPRVNHLITLNLFVTITNANFDCEAIVKRIEQTLKTKSKLLATADEDIRSLRELITYGLKGMAAYLYHANALNFADEKISAFMQSTLAKLLNNNLSGEDLPALALETGKFGVEVTALLDKANTETYGNPELTKVKLGVGKNPAILISGYDFKDLEQVA